MDPQRRIVILHGLISPDAGPDEQDVLVEVSQVSSALNGLGYAATPLPLTLDLGAAARRLRELSPLGVFNLVESIEGRDRLLHLAPSLLEHLGVSYTGASGEGMYLASNKVLAKRLLSAAGIPVPPWSTAAQALRAGPGFDPPYLVKSVWDNASRGLGEIFQSRRRLRGHLAGLSPGRRGELFVESYIEGREFNLSLLQSAEKVEVLPPAEMLFVDYPPGRPRVVGYAAKWDPESFEYRHTVRRFDFAAEDRVLLHELAGAARAGWTVLGMGGYARVDFRVDFQGNPWVLEVNPNPCLSQDAGLAAAAARAGLSYPELVRRILQPVLERGAGGVSREPPGRVAGAGAGGPS